MKSTFRRRTEKVEMNVEMSMRNNLHADGMRRLLYYTIIHRITLCMPAYLNHNIKIFVRSSVHEIRHAILIDSTCISYA